MPQLTPITDRSTEPLLTVHGLGCQIGRKTILRGVDFSVWPGKRISIIGPNGAGKTTLLKAILQIVPPSEGTVLFENRPIEKMSRRQLARRIAYVPQADGHSIPFTVDRFVMMGRYHYWGPFSPISQADLQAVEEALRLTDTEQFADRNMDTLSGGERQKVFIAAALVQETPLLLLDEPGAFLDYRHQNEIEQLLDNLVSQRGTSVVTVTHDLNRAILQSDRVIGLRDGELFFNEKPNDCFNDERLDQLFGTKFQLADHPNGPVKMVVPPLSYDLLENRSGKIE
jgi:cobalamin transport system ATP-binding protein